jgi:murein DD-endopeptidase MepM/ murein hydrolase activator NlpD
MGMIKRILSGLAIVFLASLSVPVHALPALEQKPQKPLNTEPLFQGPHSLPRIVFPSGLANFSIPKVSIPKDQADLEDLVVPYAPGFSREPVQATLLPNSQLLGPHFAVIPPIIRPGEPIAIAYTDDFSTSGSRNFQAVLIDRNGRRLGRAMFFSFTQTAEGREVKAAILALPSTAASGVYLIRIETGGSVVQDLPLVAEFRDFDAEVIALDEANTDLRTVPDPEKTRESEILWAILSRTGTQIYDDGHFIPPVTSKRRTSYFGDRRMYKYTNGSTDTSIHAGIDYGVPTGTEVRSCGYGRVVLARFRIVTGYSVIVEHLPGVYSLYYHLDSISVEENALVEQGALLGYSGATGLATGPHLHWEIRVAGEYADPDAFIVRAVLDKDEILSHLLNNN